MSIWQPKFLFWIIFFVCLFCWFLTIFFIDFDGYYIVRTDEGQLRPKYIFNKCGTNIYFFLLYRGLVHHHHNKKYLILLFFFLMRDVFYYIFHCFCCINPQVSFIENPQLSLAIFTALNKASLCSKLF